MIATFTTCSNIYMWSRIFSKYLNLLYENSLNFLEALVVPSYSFISYYIAIRWSQRISREKVPREFPYVLMLFNYRSVARDKKFLKRRSFVYFLELIKFILKLYKFLSLRLKSYISLSITNFLRVG